MSGISLYSTGVLRPEVTSSALQRGVRCLRTQESTEAQQARTSDAAFYFLDVDARVLYCAKLGTMALNLFQNFVYQVSHCSWCERMVLSDEHFPLLSS